VRHIVSQSILFSNPVYNSITFVSISQAVENLIKIKFFALKKQLGGFTMRQWDSLVDNYMRYCKTKGLATATIIGNRRQLDKWGNWLKRRKPKPSIEQIDSEYIIKYISMRTAFKARATVYGTISIMRGFGEFLVREGIWNMNPLKWIRGPRIDPRMQIPRCIKKSHLQKLWIQAIKIDNEYFQSLNLLILSLLYSTGMRRGEMERLQINSWDRENKLLKIDGQKTGQERQIPLPDVTVKCLEYYLPKRHNVLSKFRRLEEQNLLINSLALPLKGIRIWYMIKNLSKKAGISLVSLHQFRHTCASDLLEEGVGLPEIQRVLGHSSIYSTYRYTQIADPERVQAMALHPINKMLKENLITNN
jgi:site-specific recombinase XerD